MDNADRFVEISCAVAAQKINTEMGLDPQSAQCMQCFLFAATSTNPPHSRLFSRPGTPAFRYMSGSRSSSLGDQSSGWHSFALASEPYGAEIDTEFRWGEKMNHGPVPPWS